MRWAVAWLNAAFCHTEALFIGRVFQHATYTEPSLGGRYLPVILHFLLKNLQSLVFSIYLLKVFLALPKLSRVATQKPSISAGRSAEERRRGKLGFAGVGLGGRENKEKSAELQRAHFHNCPVTLAK